MKTRHLLAFTFFSAALMVTSLAAAPALATAKTWSSDKEKVQELPAGWLSEHTGQGSKGSWKVVAAPTALSRPDVLAQLSDDATVYRFPLVLWILWKTVAPWVVGSYAERDNRNVRLRIPLIAPAPSAWEDEFKAYVV